MDFKAFSAAILRSLTCMVDKDLKSLDPGSELALPPTLQRLGLTRSISGFHILLFHLSFSLPRYERKACAARLLLTPTTFPFINTSRIHAWVLAIDGRGRMDPLGPFHRL